MGRTRRTRTGSTSTGRSATGSSGCPCSVTPSTRSWQPASSPSPSTKAPPSSATTVTRSRWLRRPWRPTWPPPGRPALRARVLAGQGPRARLSKVLRRRHLTAVRVELNDVFDVTHAVLLDLYDAGVVDGFRIDHPDGLADPEGYLARLRERTDDGWVVGRRSSRVTSDSRRPGRPLAPPATTCRASSRPRYASDREPARRARRDISGDETLLDVEHAAKRQVVTTLLRPEVDRLSAASPSRQRSSG